MSGIINPETGKPLRHYAQDLVTRARYIIISLQNDTDKDTCSVVDIDALDSDTRAELVNLVNSEECQHQPEIWKVLDRKYFMNYPKQTMLKVLRGLKQIRIVKSAQVAIQCPDDVVRTPKDIIEGLNVYYATKANQGKIGMSNPYMPTEMMQTAPVQALPTAIDNQPVNDSEIKEIKEEMTQIKETVGALTTSISELVKALSESKKG
jgi:hypothetical protein|uniref:Uncharacterized protein n=1 Tax=Myoviridae sp. ctWb16 TaxID=2827690 RepID=A0A8S5T1Q0_9CAUD|nr:MAG TPA: hypothetical protein [Myoviridae sp. ctWb16]